MSGKQADSACPWNRLPSHAPRRTERLSGYVAMVYGAGAAAEDISVGQAAAFAYACAGARVIAVDRSIENAERTRARIESIGAECLVIRADVTDAGSVACATEEAVGTFGSIDVLHNNVGVPEIGEFDEFDCSDWARGVQLNCLGAATTMRYALPHLLATGRGVVTNVSSVASIRYTGIHYSVYSVSKAALNQLTVSVALEYAARGLRVNAILPGLLNTGMGRALGGIKDSPNSPRAEQSPMKFEGDPWDVANAAVYLASSEARYVNGHLLVVDGGLTLRI